MKQSLGEQFAALDPVVLLTTIRAAQQELSVLSNRDVGAAGCPDQPEYLAAFATAWHSDYRAPKGRRKNTTKHWWRSRADPFAESWPIVEGWLVAEPNLAAKELLTRLRQRLPDLYPTGAQLRTLQRRVKACRAERARELVFAIASAGRSIFRRHREATLLDTSWRKLIQKKDKQTAEEIPNYGRCCIPEK